MKYVSTRGKAPVLGFDDVLLSGLARDGGLYVPESWPTFSVTEMKRLRGLSYTDLAVEVMAPFVSDCLSREELAGLVARAYAPFSHTAIAPLKQLDTNLWLMELFSGPTLAFKDYALQFLGQAFDHCAEKARGEGDDCRCHLRRLPVRRQLKPAVTARRLISSSCSPMAGCPTYSGGR